MSGYFCIIFVVYMIQNFDNNIKKELLRFALDLSQNYCYNFRKKRNYCLTQALSVNNLQTVIRI